MKKDGTITWGDFDFKLNDYGRVELLYCRPYKRLYNFKVKTLVGYESGRAVEEYHYNHLLRISTVKQYWYQHKLRLEEVE